MRPIDHLMDRLAELAAGAEPIYRTAGICNEVILRCGEPGFDAVWDVFGHMGFASQSDPLGDTCIEGDHWSGRRGQRRRKLCYDLLVQFIASAEYRGRYQ